MANPTEGEKSLQDEQRALLAMCALCDVQMPSVDRTAAMGTLIEIFESLNNAGRTGAVEKLRKILAFSGTASVTRRPTGEQINGKDVVEETRSTIPTDGVTIILGLHLMRIGNTPPNVECVIRQLDQMGILTNTKDQLAAQGKKIFEKAQAAVLGTNIAAIEAIVQVRLSTTQYQSLMTDPELQRLRAAWEAVSDDTPQDKEVAALAYADCLHAYFIQIQDAAKAKKMTSGRRVAWIITFLFTAATLCFFVWALKGFLSYV